MKDDSGSIFAASAPADILTHLDTFGAVLSC